MKTLNKLAVSGLLAGALWAMAPTGCQRWVRWQARTMVQHTETTFDSTESAIDAWLLKP